MEHFTSLIPLASWPAEFSFEPVIDDVRMALPWAEVSHAGRPTALDTRAITLTVEGYDFTLSIHDAPLDGELLEQTLAMDRNWPDAGDTLRQCAAHALISAHDDPDDWDEARKVARIVELTASALMRHVPAEGHIWATASRLFKPEIFEMLLPDDNARALRWVNLDFFQGPQTADGEETVVVHTRGLVRFFGYEMELAALPLSPQNAAQIIMSVAQYLLDNGPVLKNGDVIGPEDGARFQLLHLPKERSHGAVKVQLCMVS